MLNKFWEDLVVREDINASDSPHLNHDNFNNLFKFTSFALNQYIIAKKSGDANKIAIAKNDIEKLQIILNRVQSKTMDTSFFDRGANNVVIIRKILGLREIFTDATIEESFCGDKLANINEIAHFPIKASHKPLYISPDMGFCYIEVDTKYEHDADKCLFDPYPGTDITLLVKRENELRYKFDTLPYIVLLQALLRNKSVIIENIQDLDEHVRNKLIRRLDAIQNINNEYIVGKYTFEEALAIGLDVNNKDVIESAAQRGYSEFIKCLEKGANPYLAANYVNKIHLLTDDQFLHIAEMLLDSGFVFTDSPIMESLSREIKGLESLDNDSILSNFDTIRLKKIIAGRQLTDEQYNKFAPFVRNAVLASQFIYKQALIIDHDDIAINDLSLEIIDLMINNEVDAQILLNIKVNGIGIKDLPLKNYVLPESYVCKFSLGTISQLSQVFKCDVSLATIEKFWSQDVYSDDVKKIIPYIKTNNLAKQIVKKVDGVNASAITQEIIDIAVARGADSEALTKLGKLSDKFKLSNSFLESANPEQVPILLQKYKFDNVKLSAAHFDVIKKLPAYEFYQTIAAFNASNLSDEFLINLFSNTELSIDHYKNQNIDLLGDETATNIWLVLQVLYDSGNLKIAEDDKGSSKKQFDSFFNPNLNKYIKPLENHASKVCDIVLALFKVKGYEDNFISNLPESIKNITGMSEALNNAKDLEAQRLAKLEEERKRQQEEKERLSREAEAERIRLEQEQRRLQEEERIRLALEAARQAEERKRLEEAERLRQEAEARRLAEENKRLAEEAKLKAIKDAEDAEKARIQATIASEENKTNLKWFQNKTISLAMSVVLPVITACISYLVGCSASRAIINTALAYVTANVLYGSYSHFSANGSSFKRLPIEIAKSAADSLPMLPENWRHNTKTIDPSLLKR